MNKSLNYFQPSKKLRATLFQTSNCYLWTNAEPLVGQVDIIECPAYTLYHNRIVRFAKSNGAMLTSTAVEIRSIDETLVSKEYERLGDMYTVRYSQIEITDELFFTHPESNGLLLINSSLKSVYLASLGEIDVDDEMILLVGCG